MLEIFVLFSQAGSERLDGRVWSLLCLHPAQSYILNWAQSSKDRYWLLTDTCVCRHWDIAMNRAEEIPHLPLGGSAYWVLGM